MQANRLTRLALVAALYVVLTQVVQLLGPGLNLSYGPVQVRVAEGLAMLALFDPLMPLALYVGCLLANLLGGMGPYDVVFGPLLSLAAGYATWYSRKLPVVPYIPPILFNALGVAAYLYLLLDLDFGFRGGSNAFTDWLTAHPYWAMVGTIGLGQTFSVVIFGTLFMRVWRISERRA